MNKIIVLLIVALATRLLMLDVRPMDHDESIHAYLSYKLLKDHIYTYNPAFHGPFLYFSSACIFALFGDSEFAARLTPVIFSIIGVLAAYGFKRWIGGGAYILVFLMLFSTSILYYSRYMRNDLILIGSFFAVLYCYFRYVESQRERFVYPAVLFVMLMITSKENGYVYMLTLSSFIVLSWIYEKRLLEKILRWDLKKLRMILISIVISLSVFASLYTAGFSDQEGLEKATIGALSYWFSMHERNDHWKPIYYYIQILLKYEFLPLGLAISSLPLFYKKLRERETTKLELFAAYWLLTAFIFYHVLSHKVPWLTVHVVAPLALFGSIYLGETLFAWRNRSFRLAFIVVAIAMLISSLHVTYINYNDASEELVYIQVQPSAVELSEEIIQRLEKGERGVVYEPKNDYWPLPWYLRHYSIPFYSSLFDVDFIVTSERMVEFVEKAGFKFKDRYEIRPGYFMVLMEKY
jgi:uncharacterized protein (TIGR03663 family)